MNFSARCQFISVGIIGVFFSLSGGLLFGFWSVLFDAVLNKQLILTPTSYSNNMWETEPFPVHMDFYFWNWTNPEDILHPDPEVRKPKLVQMGPYVYKEKRKKVILNWNNNNGTVTYLQKKTWYFEPSLSKGSIDDVVTTVNVAAIAAAFAIRDYPVLLKQILNAFFIGLDVKLVVRKKVRELLFEGYPDSLLDLYSVLPPGLIPVTIPFDKFGWFYTRNESASYEGVYNMYTGQGNMEKFGSVGEWNFENPTSVYESHCGALSGSAGELFPPKPKKGGTISVFSTDICRTLVLSYKDETTVDGIKGYRYWADEHIFDNITARPESWCYYPSGECPPHGAIDVSTCKWGVPAFISFPHFLNADKHYHEAVHGMLPNEEIHQLFVDLEQRTGLPLRVEAPLQVNILMQPSQEYNIFRGVPKIYFPTFWFKQRARIDDEIGPAMRLVSRIPDAGYIIFSAFICIGLAILCILGVYHITNRRKSSSDSFLKLVET